MSKGLEEIKTLRGFNKVELNNDKNINKSLDIIENELKVLKIIFEKNVDISFLKKCSDVSYYNLSIGNSLGDYTSPNKLTQEEFNILKEMFNNE